MAVWLFACTAVEDELGWAEREDNEAQGGENYRSLSLESTAAYTI